MKRRQLALFDLDSASVPPSHTDAAALLRELRAFTWEGKPTDEQTTMALVGERRIAVPLLVNEFWTRRQRAAHNLHEISYRACFKPQLPRFFIERLTAPAERVYDPFMGRGTTLLEAAFLGRAPLGCDVNPLSVVLTKPRLRPPFLGEVGERLRQINFEADEKAPDDLLVFYHPETLREIAALRKYLLKRRTQRKLDRLDEWIELVALNRLTGHSKGFFSVYTMPPNQAVSVKSQRKINEKRNQIPPRRDVPKLILKKSRQLLRDCNEETLQTLAQAGLKAAILTRASNH